MREHRQQQQRDGAFGGQRRLLLPERSRRRDRAEPQNGECRISDQSADAEAKPAIDNQQQIHRVPTCRVLPAKMQKKGKERRVEYRRASAEPNGRGQPHQQCEQDKPAHHQPRFGGQQHARCGG
jgi:hypothetical protein